jgi:hypothetical protein
MDMNYRCKKIDHDLTIDGNLKKPEWEAADGVVLVSTAEHSEVSKKTVAKLLWNNSWLYAAFYCEDDYIFATKTGYNEKLYEEDVVELFIDDNLDMRTYTEIEVNPLNAILHYSIHNDLSGRILPYARVDKTICSAVIQDQQKQEYTVELAIPLDEFITAANIPPRNGEHWLFNIYRINNTRSGSAEYLAWSPTGAINFHIPKSFGNLIFVE